MRKKNILIVTAKSREGMKFIPHGGTVLNIGVEEGPKQVMSNDLLNQFSDYTVETMDFVFSTPEETSDEDYYTVLGSELNNLSQKITDAVSNNNFDHVLLVGGDHSTAFSSLSACLDIHNDKSVGVIMFDSHADLHNVATSPSGNFHGMWLRPFMGDFDNEHVAYKGSHAPLSGNDIMFVGDVLWEKEEQELMESNNIHVIWPTDITQDIEASKNHLREFCNNHDIIHLSYDIDVFNTDLVTATGTPNPNGLTREQVYPLLETVLQSGKVFSFDLVEVNPQKEGADQTVALAQEVITKFSELSK